LGDWGSHVNVDLLVIISEDVTSENTERLITGVLKCAFDDGFSDDTRLIISDLKFSNGFFNGVCRAVVCRYDE
jgi:hypothetical protein